MAKFLTTRGTTSEIENIISHAENRLVLISPFVKIPDDLLQRLREANKRKIRMTLVYGKKELDTDVRNELAGLEYLSLRFLKDLHAKCFYNEDSMVITSLNLYDFSEKNNREMGILINLQEDQDAFRNAVREATSIIAEAMPTRNGHNSVNGNVGHSKTEQDGHCIKCGGSIPSDLDKPYCRDCYKIWHECKDSDHKESYCHTCGKRDTTTLEKPQCRSCYKQLSRVGV